MKTRVIWTTLSCLVLTACASYTQQSERIRSTMYRGDYDDALKKLDQSEIAKSRRDLVLYHMERGTLLYLSGQYTAAAQEWAKASKRVDELYTVSVSNTAASYLVNESYTDFEGEEHEKVLLPAFSAIAYFANQEPNKAIVEARRTYELLNVLNANKDAKNTYTRDAFAHYLCGLIYEAKEEWDAAIVEYRNAFEAGQTNRNWAATLSLTPIAEALGRLAEYRNRSELITMVRKQYPDLRWQKQVELNKMGEVYVIYEAGKTPIKHPSEIFIPLDNGIARISFPEFRTVGYSSRGASVLVDGKNVGRTVVMNDIGALAKQALSDRRFKDTAKMIARIVAKDQASRAAGRQFGPLAGLLTSVAGAVTETADTRGWTSLPDTLQIKRVPVTANKQTKIYVQPDYGKPEEVVVTLREGEKRLIRMRTFN